MFTGIITDVGEIIQLEKKGDLRARIKTNYDEKGIEFGAYIACDGICITAVDFGNNWFDVDSLCADLNIKPIVPKIYCREANSITGYRCTKCNSFCIIICFYPSTKVTLLF